MESFSLLKYWRGGGGVAVATALRSSTPTPAAAKTASALLRPSPTITDDGGRDEDDGPFFDLVFSSLPVDDGSADAYVEEGAFKIELGSRGGGGLRPEGFSPSNDLFFNGKLVPLEPSSLVVAASEYTKSQLASVSLLKSATKFRIFLLRLRKPKFAAAEPNATAIAAVATASPRRAPQQQHQSRFFVKVKAEDVPIISLFVKDKTPSTEDSVAAAEEKRFAREVVQKYLNVMKPQASRRYGEKLRLQCEAVLAKECCCRAEESSAGMGKGRLIAMPRKTRPAPPSGVTAAPLPSQRRDDTLREQQDGIQRAIAHCKRSLTASEIGKVGEATAHDTLPVCLKVA
ncbi:hypothetical protein Cni_G09495 [Canna indica]|uniref:Membrane-associated kinase regulator 2 n=1 Tax=Canna indica TaxID=4628 RepID=A0AAQ3K5Q9_9LILI|nr:hypothetical protein Cni_G09495 [Canna indica]